MHGNLAHRTLDDKTPLTAEQQGALKAMMSGQNVFLTGKGGTGKSRVVREFVKIGKQNLVCLASTGLAALNLGKAATIHSFFELQIGVADFKRDSLSLYRKLSSVDVILIDEISMVRSDVFAAMDEALRYYLDRDEPFGGKQLIVVGDFYQLPPVVNDDNLRLYLEAHFDGEYAFCCQAWHDAGFARFNLRTVMRQRDADYIKVLDAVRHSSIALKDGLNRLAGRVEAKPDDAIALCCTRAQAESINLNYLAALPDRGARFRGQIKGRFPFDQLPADWILSVKRGEQIMLLSNRPGVTGYDYVNGEFGTIIDHNDRFQTITVKLPEKIVSVSPAKWSNYEYFFNEETEQLEQKEVGSFMQFPIAPAYATTIHKAQGQTLSKAHVVLGRGCFANGQLYTALSRVRDFESLSLDRPVRVSDALTNPRIVDFNQDEI